MRGEESKGEERGGKDNIFKNRNRVLEIGDKTRQDRTGQDRTGQDSRKVERGVEKNGKEIIVTNLDELSTINRKSITIIPHNTNMLYMNKMTSSSRYCMSTHSPFWNLFTSFISLPAGPIGSQFGSSGRPPLIH